MGDELLLKTADGPMRSYAATPDDPRGAVIVIPEAFGLNGHITDVVRRFADAGFAAIGLDVFHRSGAGVADYGDWARVMELFSGLENDEQLLVDIDAGLDHLGAVGFSPPAVGVVGFCFGGRTAFLVAARRSIGAAVSFYGGGIVTKGMLGSFPSLLDEASTLKTPWLGLFGDEDGSIPVADVEQLRGAVAAADVETDVVRYVGAGHGFHCDVREEYHAEAAPDAWRRTIGFYARLSE